jgi:hypothetical protein
VLEPEEWSTGRSVFGRLGRDRGFNNGDEGGVSTRVSTEGTGEGDGDDATAARQLRHKV